MDAVFTAQELADRWKCHINTIRVMEDKGLLHRLPDIPNVRFSADEVQKLECVGIHAPRHTEYEFKKLEAKVRELEQIVKRYQERETRVMLMLQGGI